MADLSAGFMTMSSWLSGAGFQASLDALIPDQAIWLQPNGSYLFDRPITVPPGHPIFGNGAQIRFNHPDAQFYIPDADSIYRDLRIDGNDIATNPLKIGSGPGGKGAKARFENITVRRVGAGGTGAQILNLQNSSFSNFRVADSVAAKTAVLISDGSKNLYFTDMFPTSCPIALHITTGGGDQRTSKIFIKNGLAEVTGGFLIGDAEHVHISDFQINRGGTAPKDGAFTFVKDGGRLVKGVAAAHGPDAISIKDSGAKGFKYGFDLRPEVYAALHTGGMFFADTEVTYQVDSDKARVFQVAPHFAGGVKEFVSNGSALSSVLVKP